MARIKVEKRKLQIQELRKFEVRGDPRYHYVWVNPELGPPDDDYEPVRKEEVERGEVSLALPRSAVDDPTDNIVKREGMELWKVPQELFEEKQKAIEEKIMSLRRSIEKEETMQLDKDRQRR